MAKVTLADVALRAGVSASTASLVLGGSTRIPPATHERVRAAISELGYVYNRAAANMRLRKSMTIGFVATDISNPYFADVTMAIADGVHDKGYTLFTGFTRDRRDAQHEQIDAMVQRQVDGIVLLPAIGTTQQDLDAAVGNGPPLVQINRYFSHSYDYVGPDNLRASALLAQHLVSLGGGRVVLVGGPEGSSAREERLEGLRQGFYGTGMSFQISDCVATPNNADGGALGLSLLIDSGILPDVIIAYSDAIAMGVYAELRRRDLEPGRECAVASFDDIPFASLQIPQLTSVATHPIDMGQQAAQLLIRRISEPHRPSETVLIEPTLKPRASTVLWRARNSTL